MKNRGIVRHWLEINPKGKDGALLRQSGVINFIQKNFFELEGSKFFLEYFKLRRKKQLYLIILKPDTVK